MIAPIQLQGYTTKSNRTTGMRAYKMAVRINSSRKKPNNLLIIDNFDSFTYNLAAQIKWIAHISYHGLFHTMVLTNNQKSSSEILSYPLSGLIISPGPGSPKDTGVVLELLAHAPHSLPTLGICLGHQTIGFHHGATVSRAIRPVHGHTHQISYNKTGLFSKLNGDSFSATRYHSLVIDPNTIPGNLVIDAWTNEGEIMAIHHTDLPHWGLQFHPESFLTSNGDELISAFLDKCLAYTETNYNREN